MGRSHAQSLRHSVAPVESLFPLGRTLWLMDHICSWCMGKEVGPGVRTPGYYLQLWERSDV